MNIYNIELIKDKKEKKICYDFVKNNHYTKMVGAGSNLCFGLYENKKLIGVGLWREPNGRLTYKLFDVFNCNYENNKKILDLTRLVLIDETRKNTESYFLGWMIKYIKNKLKIDYLITYADFNQGHNGIIYKASNWMSFGLGGDSRKVYKINEDGTCKLTSSRWIHLKKDKVIIIKIQKKFRYIYPLNIKRKKFIKNYKNILDNFKKEHEDLEKEYKKYDKDDFSLKEIENKCYCFLCKKFYDLEEKEECEFCNKICCNKCVIYNGDNYLCDRCR